MGKTIDLQPYLDYFEMLQAYIEKGFLEVVPAKGAAYITEAALNTLSNTDASPQEDSGILEGARLLRAYTATLRRIRTYAGWRSQEGTAFFDRPFALYVVKDEHPHDALYILLMTTRRRWWAPWSKCDHVEVIPVTEKEP